MDLETLLNSMTPEVYQNLKSSIEIGKWPNGQALTKEQISLCMEAVMLYEYKNLPVEQHTGYIEGKNCGSKSDKPEKLNIIDFKDGGL